jgi:hypothetical protein
LANERLRSAETQKEELEASCQQTRAKLDALQILHKTTAADLEAARQTLQKKASRVEKAGQVRFRRETQAQRAETAWL